jgi:hypothetical protein
VGGAQGRLVRNDHQPDSGPAESVSFATLS